MSAVDVITWIIFIITIYFAFFWLITFLGMGQEKKRKALKKFPLVSVVIPAFNEEETITGTMKSVVKLDYPKNKIQIIVVNDGSTDSTEKKVKDFIKKHPGRKIMLISQKNSGKWVCMNAGLSIAKGEFFACLDADSFVERETLKRMLPHFVGRTAIVLPIMKVKNPKNMLQKVQWYEYIVNMFYKKIAAYINCVHVAPGPFSLYRTSVLRKVGGFRYGYATEDLEIAMRLQKHNYRIVQTMDAEVYTIAPDNMRELYKQRVRWNKGALLNAISYKEMLFNRAYGDFAMIQMPLVIAAGFISAVLIVIFLYYGLLKPLYNLAKKVVLVHFDIMTLIRNIQLNANILDADFYRLVIAVFTLVITITIFVAAHRHSKEKIVKYGFFPLLVYLFVYYIALGLIWLVILKDLAIKKSRMRW
ncbi:MAG: glycosyltransferase family 2 protein [Candidatus Woesearchaeota archaeon]|nr:glycosyltransferase family 2 protein [Candidatus Woesearchaeota archaeon]